MIQNQVVGETVSVVGKSLGEIAYMVRKDWKQVHYTAQPYLDALGEIAEDGTYYQDSWQSVVAYFLCNVGTWKGDNARMIKAELKRRLKINNMKG